MFIYIYRNPKKPEIGSGTKLFITFLSLRFFDMQRERHNFFLWWLFHLTPPRAAHFVDPNWSRLASNLNFQLTQPTCGARSAESCLASPRSESQLTGFFFFKFQNPQRFRTSFTSPIHLLSGFFIVTSLIVTSAPRAREHLHSTNPCTN